MESFKHWISKHHFLIAIVFIIAVLSGLFSKIIEDVYEKDSRIVNLDSSIAHYIYTYRVNWLNDIFLLITQLGNPIPQGIAFVSALVIFFAYKKYTQLAIIFSTVAGSAVITYVIKNFVQRERPLDGLILEHGFSFPSGHAFIAVCFWGVLFYLLSTLTKNKPLKALLLISGSILTLLIGFSRVYIGVHWPSDIVASFLLASAYSIATIVVITRGVKRMQFK